MRRPFDSRSHLPPMVIGEANARLALAVSTIAFGYFLRRIGLVDVEVGKALLKVLFNATLPSVLLMTFASLTFDATSVAVSLCALGQAAVLFLAHLAFRGKGRAPKEIALLAGSCVGVNLGTFCYPLVEAVWGMDGLTRVVLFDAVNQWSLLIIAPLIYASSTAGDDFSPSRALANVKKQLVSPCLLAMFAAIALRLADLTLPSPVTAFTSSLAVANKPLALIALGILFDPRLKDGQLRDIASLLALRYGASLTLGAFIVAVASNVGTAVLGVVLAALISPVPLLTVTYAVEYDCDVGLGASAVNAANFFSFALLLAVANANLANPSAVAIIAAAGLTLTFLGVWGARGSGSTKKKTAERGGGAAMARGIRAASSTAPFVSHRRAFPTVVASDGVGSAPIRSVSVRGVGTRARSIAPLAMRGVYRASARGRVTPSVAVSRIVFV